MFSEEDIPSEEMLEAAKSEVFTETKAKFLAGDFSEKANPLSTALLNSPCLRQMADKCLSVIETTDNPLDVYSCLLTFFMLGHKVGRAQMVKIDDETLFDTNKKRGMN